MGGERDGMARREGSGGKGYRPTGRALAIVEDLCCEDVGLAEVAARHGMTLAVLARWSGREGNVRLLERLRALALLRGSLLAARARAEAAVALRRLAMDRKHPETARKACVDLLSMRVDGEEVTRAVGAERGGGDEEDRDEVIRGILEKLGGEGLEVSVQE